MLQLSTTNIINKLLGRSSMIIILVTKNVELLWIVLFRRFQRHKSTESKKTNGLLD